MKYRQLGASDLEVSEISLGSWLTYGVGVEADAARACLDRAFEVGINFIDTANIYGRGAAETFLGEALAGRPRDSYILATKLFFPMTDSDRGLSAAQIEKQLDASLKRLRDRLCRSLPMPPLRRGDAARGDDAGADPRGRERQGALYRLFRMAGRQDPGGDRHGGRRPLRLQPAAIFACSGAQPEKEVIPLCAANGISQIVWSPLAQGVLTGKYAPGAPPPPGSRATSEEMGGWMDRLLRPPVLEAVQRLKPLAAEAGLSLAQFALAWVLREPNVASAIVGASRPSQVDENAAASDAEVDPALFAEAERIVGLACAGPRRRVAGVVFVARGACRTAGRAPSARGPRRNKR